MNVDLVIKKFLYLSQDIKSTVIGHAVEKYLTGDLKKNKSLRSDYFSLSTVRVQWDNNTKLFKISFWVKFFKLDFRSSLPIIVDLKNEALRERHWWQVIEETHIDIDLTNNILTLENIFQMNLQQYNEIIQSN